MNRRPFLLTGFIRKQTLLVTTTIAGLLPGLGACSQQTSPKVNLPESYVLIDARTPSEYHSGHVRGAILIPYDQIAAQITRHVPEKKTPIRVYCRSGRRASMALDTLQNMGYEDLGNLVSVKNAASMTGREITTESDTK